MQSRLLLLAVFILSKPQEVMGLGHSCLKWRLDNDGQTRVAFLREEEATGVRSLYLSVWSGSMRLVGCELNSDPGVTEGYRALCDSTESPQNAPGFNISALLAADGPCARVTSGAPKFSGRARSDGGERSARRKRAWILPGTLWCGRGSEAVRYEQLGMFENTDRCCREHDHCLHIIPPFRVNYGVFNPNLYVVSHCECDQRFRECLLSVNDTISSMVGYSFFNILRVPCFELKQKRRCTEMYWWGICKVAKEAPYAVFKPSRPYNTSDTTSTVTSGENTDINRPTHVTEQPVTSLHRRSPKSQHRCGSRGPPRGDTFHHRRKKGEACKRQPPVAPSQIPTISRSKITTPSINMGHLNVSKSRELTTKKKRVGKKRGINNSSTKSQVPPQAIVSYPQRSNPSSTHQLHLPATITVTRTPEIHKKAPKHRRRCKSRKLLRDDTLRQRCKSCSEQESASHVTAATPATTTNASHVNVTAPRASRLDKTKETSTRATLVDATFARNRTTAAFLRVNARAQKQVDFYLLQDNIRQEPAGSSVAQSNSLRNMTDNHLICGSLKHLDECKYKIPPMEKRYDLQNVESKAVYHCDCTSRLAVEFEGFNQLSVLPMLLKNYVSQYCFNLPKDKKCLTRKSCSGGFAVASDLLQTLKETDVTDATWGRYSDINKRRGFPVRLYKRCLRLKREAVHLKIQ